jgi:hypothetical protein
MVVGAERVFVAAGLAQVRWQDSIQITAVTVKSLGKQVDFCHMAKEVVVQCTIPERSICSGDFLCKLRIKFLKEPACGFAVFQWQFAFVVRPWFVFTNEMDNLNVDKTFEQ